MDTRGHKRSADESIAEIVRSSKRSKRGVNEFIGIEDDPFAHLHQPSPKLESHPEAKPKTMKDSPISADNQTTPNYSIITGGKESHPGDKPAMKGRGLVPKRLNFSDEVIKVCFDGKDGEYVLKVTTGDKKDNAMEEQAQAAAMLLSQAAMLRGLGETLLSNLQAQFEPQFFKSLNMKEPTE